MYTSRKDGSQPMKKHHPLINTLFNLKGNAKACVLTEPLWGIPFNLYAPYASLYMLALGVTDVQIGLIISLGMVLQIFTALLSGAITDKLGRKRATLIFDILSWSVPCLIWAIAQSFVYFAIAAMVNSLWRITMNSWTCLLVEDCDQEILLDVYSWVHISGLLAAFFAPLAGLLIAWHGLVPTVRFLYLLTFVMMTTKFIVLNIFVKETQQGEIRKKETAGQSIPTLLSQYAGVLRHILQTRQTLMTLGMMLVMSISSTVNNAFWPILITERIGVAEGLVGLFPFFRSLIMLVLYFVIVPRINARQFGKPMLLGFGAFILGQILLISAPELGYLFIIGSTFLEACALALVSPLLDSLIVITVDPNERARIMALLYVVIIAITSPFGWIAGLLSEANRILPFVMNICLYTLGALLALISMRRTLLRREVDYTMTAN